MKTQDTFPGKTYAVTSPNGCTVTTEDGITLAEIEAGKQGYFVAVSGKVQLSDDAAVLTQLFKLAPYQKLRLLGVVGGNANGLPAGYKRVEYLEVTGAQYAQTRLTITANCEIACDGTYINGYPSFYSQEGFDEGCGVLLSLWGVDGGGFYFGWRENHRYWLDINMLDTNKSFSSINKLGYYKLNNWEAIVTDAEFVNPVDKFFLIGRHVNTEESAFRIFKLQVSREGRIIFDAIPAVDCTGAPCFFERISRVTYYNQGSGDFLYPTASTTYSLRRVLPDWGKLTENGLRRLYHAPASYTGELYDYAIENGYKPIVETEQPEEGYWSPRWTETEDEIILEWVETEPPMDEDLTETE